MSRAYEEIVEFIAGGTTSDAVANFEASEGVKEKVASLIHREKAGDLTPDEKLELDQFLQLEHVMRLAKARARAQMY